MPTVELPLQRLKPGDVTLHLQIQLPPGTKLNDQAPTKVILTSNDGNVTLANGSDSLILEPLKFPFLTSATVKKGAAEISADLYLYYCRTADESLCFFKQVRLMVPLVIQDDAGDTGIEIAYTLE